MLMKKPIQFSALIALIAVAAGWAGWRLHANRPQFPVAGLIHRSKVDRGGHTRGIVQVDLMRQIMADRARAPAPAGVRAPEAGQLVPTHDHPLLGHPAPSFVLGDAWGRCWSLRTEVRNGPVVVVFYLGSTCMACVTHLTELDAALSQFRARGVRMLAVSGDAPGFSMERMRKYGAFQIPLLSDSDRSISRTYGVWKPAPGSDNSDGEAQHGTFVVDRDGIVQWAYVGDRPFTDIDALLAAVDGLKGPSSRQAL
jgi:peroxiredoxin